MEAMKCERVISAVLANIDQWIESLVEIEHFANPGNKVRTLHLIRNMTMAKIALQRIASDHTHDPVPERDKKP